MAGDWHGLLHDADACVEPGYRLSEGARSLEGEHCVGVLGLIEGRSVGPDCAEASLVGGCDARCRGYGTGDCEGDGQRENHIAEAVPCDGHFLWRVVAREERAECRSLLEQRGAPYQWRGEASAGSRYEHAEFRGKTHGDCDEKGGSTCVEESRPRDPRGELRCECPVVADHEVAVLGVAGSDKGCGAAVAHRGGGLGLPHRSVGVRERGREEGTREHLDLWVGV